MKSPNERVKILLSKNLATTAEQYDALGQNPKSPIIHSLDEWRGVLKNEGSEAVLPRCDASVVDAFTSGLKFGRGRLAHSNYSMIVDRLSHLEFIELLGRFGLSLELFSLWDNENCVSGICESNPNFMCDPTVCGRSA
jgi:hypothetical protein